jgi:hypothetical protein
LLLFVPIWLNNGWIPIVYSTKINQSFTPVLQRGRRKTPDLKYNALLDPTTCTLTATLAWKAAQTSSCPPHFLDQLKAANKKIRGKSTRSNDI